MPWAGSGGRELPQWAQKRVPHRGSRSHRQRTSMYKQAQSMYKQAQRSKSVMDPNSASNAILMVCSLSSGIKIDVDWSTVTVYSKTQTCYFTEQIVRELGPAPTFDTAIYGNQHSH